MMSPRNPLILGSKGQSSRSQGTKTSMSVFRWNILLPLAVYISYTLRCNTSAHKLCWWRWIFCITSHSRCCCRLPVFPCMELFAVSQWQQTLPEWIMALLWVLASCSWKCNNKLRLTVCKGRAIWLMQESILCIKHLLNKPQPQVTCTEN